MLLGLVGIGAWWALSSEEPAKPQQAQANNPPANNGKAKPAEAMPVKRVSVDESYYRDVA